MAQVSVTRALPLVARFPGANLRLLACLSPSTFGAFSSLSPDPRRFRTLFTCRNSTPSFLRTVSPGWPIASVRGFRKTRRRPLARKNTTKERQLELDVKICLEEELPDDPEVLNIAEILRLNAPMVMKIVFDGLNDSDYKTRDRSIDDVGNFDKVELSIMLCNDSFIQKLNKEWRDEDHATDVLSMSQHIPGFDLPILMLGDIVISVETAARQAAEREHSLLDEIRILLVHGLLHLLGFDHEISDEAEAEMEKEEEVVLKSLGWKGKGLISSACDAIADESEPVDVSKGNIINEVKKEVSLRFYKPKFKYIFCDMDGTLLNSKSQITRTNAEALREATSRGVKVVIATGKTRPAAISALQTVDLAGKKGIASTFSPGVFLQKLLFYGTAESVSSTLRPHWSGAVRDRARVVQAQADMLEIVPPGTSKGEGVSMLLSHLGATANEVMAIGDGENDIEMLKLASLGVVLENGVEKAKAVADVIAASNDDDGVADAIYRYAF